VLTVLTVHLKAEHVWSAIMPGRVENHTFFVHTLNVDVGVEYLPDRPWS